MGYDVSMLPYYSNFKPIVLINYKLNDMTLCDKSVYDNYILLCDVSGLKQDWFRLYL